MALIKSKGAAGQVPTRAINDSLVRGIPFEMQFAANQAAPAVGDIIDLGDFPVDAIPVDAKLFSDDLDSNGVPTITFSLGFLNAAKTDLGAGANDTFIAATTIPQTGGVARATLAAPYLSGASSVTRRLGLKVTAAAATWAGQGKKVCAVIEVFG